VDDLEMKLKIRPTVCGKISHSNKEY